jgi:LPXTG-motif cell wall-anchored protein
MPILRPVGGFQSITEMLTKRGKHRMNKVIAGLIVACAAALGSLGLSSPAQAYPDTPPTSDGAPPRVDSAAPDSSQAAPTVSASSNLPSTGGPNAVLLGGGAALVIVGGATVVVARRRQNN